MSKVVEKFIKYVKLDTSSKEDSTTVPSTGGQLVLGKELAKELGRSRGALRNVRCKYRKRMEA